MGGWALLGPTWLFLVLGALLLPGLEGQEPSVLSPCLKCLCVYQWHLSSGPGVSGP